MLGRFVVSVYRTNLDRRAVKSLEYAMVVMMVAVAAVGAVGAVNKPNAQLAQANAHAAAAIVLASAK